METRVELTDTTHNATHTVTNNSNTWKPVFTYGNSDSTWKPKVLETGVSSSENPCRLLFEITVVVHSRVGL